MIKKAQYIVIYWRGNVDDYRAFATLQEAKEWAKEQKLKGFGVIFSQIISVKLWGNENEKSRF